MKKKKINWGNLITGVFGNIFLLGILSIVLISIFAPAQLDKVLSVVMPVLWVYIGIIGIFFLALVILMLKNA